jgi:peptidoglycan/LPS O-acetylase OafA/YrhL
MMIDHERFLALRRFDSLDGLRAISVVAVVWQHTAAKSFAGTPLATIGGEGVTLFFAISGFLITTLLLRERDRHGAIDLRAFYLRRTLRIFPIYYSTLVAYVVLVWLLERNSEAGQEFFRNLPYFLTYTTNWFVELEGRTIFYFSWSLAAEEQFYLVWPPLLAWLATRKRALAFIVVVVAVLVIHQLALSITGDWQNGIKWMKRFPLAIVMGAGFALLVHERTSFERLQPLFGNPLSSCMFAGMLAVSLILPGTPTVVTHLACVLLVVSVCIAEHHALHRLLTWLPLVYVGSISYGIYLLHMLSSNAANKILVKVGLEPTWAASFFAALITSVVVAGLSYRYFESPFLVLKKRFER